MADIFISYAREDEVRIRQLTHVLGELGWTVFWDRRIPAGQTWRSYLGQELSDAGCVIVAWSRYSIASKWVIEEADEGQQRGVLVPVLLEAVEPPIGFRGIQAGDLTDWKPGRLSPHFDHLVQDIKAVLVNTPTPAPIARPTKQRSVTSRRLHEILRGAFKYPLIAGVLVLMVGIGYLGYEKHVTDFATPGPSQKLPAPPALGVGTLKILNLKTGTVEVYSQDSEGDYHFQKGYVGTLSPEATTLQVPAGTYKLKFGKFFLENIEAKVGQPIEILLGAIVYPGVNRRVEVYSQDSEGDYRFQKGYVGTLSPEATTLQVPAGTYKLKFGKFFLENIVVKSGKETVLKG